jgi:superfamily II DNA or RNA helicase
MQDSSTNTKTNANSSANTLNTYIGQKGYTILKKEMTDQQISLIKKELMVRPYIPGSPVNNHVKSFPAYRESVQKYYLPRYFGEEHFGHAKEIKLTEGHDISVAFQGELREHQWGPVNAYLNKVCATSTGGGGLLDLPCAFGKTSLSLYILSQLKKKTIVLVHKEFLFNQWIERIQQFLPGARIGKIQGPIIDIENKDIVLGMIQSLSMKEYPPSTFESFGLTIIDEVHHISSEVFSNTLFKLVTKYMLGLSATMNRKDGTSKVFKMFLGDVVFKENRKQDHPVVVRALEYKIEDDEFNEIVYDFRGNPQFSTMITKLCNYNRRSEFILRVLGDMLIENPNQQVMILAHNKSLLKYLYDAIAGRNIASVGYYVGGMKEAALKESEGKKVIIATYSMAAEGLDIKTLTTLIMATPKTDIEQSVGRILRERHGTPVVVDVIDKHDLFQKQWAKRKTFYRKQNSKIIQTTNADYTSDTSQWRVVESKNKIIADSTCSKETNDNILQGTCFIKIKPKSD